MNTLVPEQLPAPLDSPKYEIGQLATSLEGRHWTAPSTKSDSAPQGTAASWRGARAALGQEPERGQLAGTADACAPGGLIAKQGKPRTAETLGVSARILACFEQSRRRTPALAGALERLLSEGGGSAVVTQRQAGHKRHCPAARRERPRPRPRRACHNLVTAWRNPAPSCFTARGHSHDCPAAQPGVVRRDGGPQDAQAAPLPHPGTVAEPARRGRRRNSRSVAAGTLLSSSKHFAQFGLNVRFCPFPQPVAGRY